MRSGKTIFRSCDMAHYALIFAAIVDGKEVAEGTAVELAKHFNFDKDTIYTYEKKKFAYKDKVRFIRKGKRLIKAPEKKKAETKKPKPTKHEMDLEWIKDSLIRYGNTGYHTDGKEFKAELKKAGIRFKATPSAVFKGDYIFERIE